MSVVAQEGEQGLWSGSLRRWPLAEDPHEGEDRISVLTRSRKMSAPRWMLG